MKERHVYMTTQPSNDPDDDDDGRKTVKEAHEDGDGSGYQKD